MYKIASFTSLNQNEYLDIHSLIKSDSQGFFIYNRAIKIPYNIQKIVDGKLQSKSEQARLPNLLVAKVKSAKVIGKGAVLSNNVVYEESLQNWITASNCFDNKKFIENKYSLKQTGETWSLKDDTSDAHGVDVENAILLATASDDEFSHFIFESLSKLSTLDKSEYVKYHFIINENKIYQKEILVTFGISEDKIIIKKTNSIINCKNLVFIQPPANYNHWITPAAVNFLRRKFTPEVVSKPQGGYFIHKKDEGNGRTLLSNSSVVEYFCHDNGVKKLETNDTQINSHSRIISTAKILIGEYRTGMSLAFLANKEAKVINLQSPTFFRNFNHFIAAVVGFKTISIVGSLKNDDDKKPNAEFSIRPIEAIESLEAL
ncbi:glycosyltransferase 61 family protein [Pantoea sp. A4]|uniref:glycosyltransferase 61 family protein n=1 Tax=Pantoea sp. A4 TaxID=1225184 RepID=UPI000375F176|nr:glycosyltransferase 61 family protein [Pantoea sp. A4]